MRVLLASRSADKSREIRAILRGVPELTLVDLNDVGIAPSEEEKGIEAFETFAENAIAKARYFQAKSGLPTIADDSGLVVYALDGRPGVRSKRFAPMPPEVGGEERDRANNEYLLELLGDTPLPGRGAKYVCAAALLLENGDPIHFEGEAEGRILGSPRGWGGFGYDPLFFDPALGKTFAEITPAEKDARSHRGRAFRKLAEFLMEGSAR